MLDQMISTITILLILELEFSFATLNFVLSAITTHVNKI